MEEKSLVKIDIIPSKSFAHRALILDFLKGGEPSVHPDFDSEDILATKKCLKALSEGRSELEAGESGSTLRFLIPLAAALGRDVTFVTKGKLAERPLGPFKDELKKHGVTVETESKNVKVSGKLKPGKYSIPGDISSQFVTGLLMALPTLEGDSEIGLTTPLKSSAYVDITLKVMSDFGVDIKEDKNRYLVRGGRKYRRDEEYIVEGDYSGAAFWLVLGTIGERPVMVNGLIKDSIQGDRAIVDIIGKFGGKAEVSEGSVTAYPSELTAADIDIDEVPDLAPAISVLGAAASGVTRLLNCGRLRLKESDRLEAIIGVLKDAGVGAEPGVDGRGRESIVINGTGASKEGAVLPIGGEVDGMNDHRIVMMAAVLSAITAGKILISGSKAVAKSYPGFFDEMEKNGLSDNLERL